MNQLVLDRSGQGGTPQVVDAVPAPDSAAASAAGALDIDLRKIWAALYRNIWLMAAIMAVVIVLGVIVTLLSTPIYRAKSSIQIEQQSSRVLDEHSDVEPQAALADGDRFLQTQVDILKSRSLAQRVAEATGLLANDDFLLAMKARPVGSGSSPAAAREARRRATVNLLVGNMTASLPRSSRIVTLGFDSPSALTAQTIANAYADNFISSTLSRKFDASSYARDFLQNQLAATKTRLEQSEREMIAYARGAELIDTSGGVSADGTATGTKSLITARLVALNSLYLSARAGRIQAEQRWRQASGAGVMTLPEVLSSSVVQSLLGKRAELAASYREEGTRRKADYPTMQQAAAGLEETNQQLRRAADSIRNSIREQYNVALQQEQALDRDLTALKSATMAEQDRSVRYNILKREVDTNRVLYDGLLQRYKEVAAAAGVTANNVSVIDRAEIPTIPERPRPAINMALALVFGTFLALLVVFIREKYDDTVRMPDDVEDKLGIPLLGSVPRLAKDVPPIEELRRPGSEMSEAYFSIRTSLQLVGKHGLPRSILMTSSEPAEGKTTSALALARNLATIGARVLLIDCDLRRPSIHSVFGLSRAKGVTNILANQARIADVVQDTDLDNLKVIASGPLPPTPTELLAGTGLADLIRTALLDYTIVLIDGPPVMGLSDAPLIASVVDGVVLVVEVERSHRGRAKSTVRRLQDSRATVLGAILTKFDARRAGFGSDYRYIYQYGSSDRGAVDA